MLDRRRQRDRRAAARPRRAVLRHLLVLQLRRRIPPERVLPAESGRRCRDRLHRRLWQRASSCRRPVATPVTFIGCCDLGFEMQALQALRTRPRQRRPVVHVHVRAHRRLPVRLRQHRRTPRPPTRPPSPKGPTPSTRTSVAPTSPSCRLSNEGGLIVDERRRLRRVRRREATSTTTSPCASTGATTCGTIVRRRSQRRSSQEGDIITSRRRSRSPTSPVRSSATPRPSSRPRWTTMYALDRERRPRRAKFGEIAGEAYGGE